MIFLDIVCIAQQAKDYDEAIIVGDELSFKLIDSYAIGQTKKTGDTLKSQLHQEERYLEIIEEADSLFSKYRFNDALVEYNKALAIFPDDAYTKGKINRIEQINKTQNEDSENFNRFMAAGISLLDQNKFIDAIQNFKKARKLHPENNDPDKYIAKTKEAKISLEAKFAEYSKEIDLASKYIDAEEYLKAINHLKKAQGILPDNWAVANEIKNYELLAERQLNETKINEIKSNQIALKLSVADNNEITTRKYEEVIPDITESISNLPKYNTSVKIVSDSASATTYQPEIDIIIEHNQKEIDEIAANLKKLKEIDARYTAHIENAQDLFNKKQFHESRISFVSASQIKPTELVPKQYIATIDSIIRNKEIQKQIEQRYNSYIVKGDSLLNLNLFDKSISAFSIANTIIPGDTLANNKLQRAENKKIDFNREIQIMSDYNIALNEADKLLAEQKYLLSKTAFKKAQIIKPEEAYPTEKIKEISEILAKIESANNKKYNNAISVAENYYKSSRLVEAIIQYKIAFDIKPDESYPKNRIAEINTLIEEELKKTRDKYDLAIANADKLYSGKIYDLAIDEYREASNTLPDASYPEEMISKIINLMEENAILNIFNDTIMISAETTKRFDFEPVNINMRRNSYIFFKATNISGNANKLIVNFGSDKGKNGGFVVVLAKGVEKNDYIIRVGNQYKWFADDNNWISIYPEKGDIQLSIMQISKSN